MGDQQFKLSMGQMLSLQEGEGEERIVLMGVVVEVRTFSQI